MAEHALLEEARSFVAAEWPKVLMDLERLIEIDSSEDLQSAKEGAPFGAGPRKVLDEAFDMARGYGFEPQDCGGYCGFVQVKGDGTRQIGIIGHLDVVPAGEGWSVPPFKLTVKNGYLLGRGTADDKGPLLMAFHALRFWRDRFKAAGRRTPCDVRFIFGCGEETGMGDADYYMQHYEAPDFLFTPDADFPLCYGEKGQLQVKVTSKRVADGAIVAFGGGTALNGVPGSAEALVRHEGAVPGGTERVQVERTDGNLVRLRASGVTGHAAMPQRSVNAVGLLARFMLDSRLGNTYERAWLQFVSDAASAADGSGLGLACSDEDFGPLTCVASIAELQDGVFTQALDVRFPATASSDSLLCRVQERAGRLGASVETVNAVEPLLVSPDSPEVRALRDAYEEATGCEARLFTMGGGTYAHHFPRAVSFGAMDEGRFPRPAWVGGMHAADEGVAQDCLKDALVVYIIALGKLFDSFSG